MLSPLHELFRIFAATMIAVAPLAQAQESHTHRGSAQLGVAHFPVSCESAVQARFDDAVALLHSFDYKEAESLFKEVAQADPGCAMAWWGAAMTHFHQLWQPPIPPDERATAQQQIAQAQRLVATEQGRDTQVISARESQFIAAAAMIFQNDSARYAALLNHYEEAMAAIAAANAGDVEAQMFYALALLANAPPEDHTHEKQKKAADILEPLYAKYPQHPGAAHYLIHAYDNAELSQRGLPMARAYSKIAPAVPHALHMPSHIFTRVGMWEDSIASNAAARAAARQAGDTGEELHAMDYLVYAYLQYGREADARRVVVDLEAMPHLNMTDFKIGYAATAMPIRYMVERGDWKKAAVVTVPTTAPPHVQAIAVWAHGLGLARGEQHADAAQQISELSKLEDQLAISGNLYWAAQTKILRTEVLAWAAQAQHHRGRAIELLRAAADGEDAMEKLPVTPGPIVPAREQLGQLLLASGEWEAAAREFRLSLLKAPGRRGAISGLAEATRHLQPQATVN